MTPKTRSPTGRTIRITIPRIPGRGLSSGVLIGGDGCSDDGIAISGEYYRSIDTAMARDVSAERDQGDAKGC